MTAFNEASRLAAEACTATVENLETEAPAKLLMLSSRLRESHLVVIERELVERLYAALKVEHAADCIETLSETGCICGAEEALSASVAAKAAGFGGKA